MSLSFSANDFIFFPLSSPSSLPSHYIRFYGPVEPRLEPKAPSQHATETVVLQPIVGAAVFFLDWRLHPRIPGLLSANVDLQTRI